MAAHKAVGHPTLGRKVTDDEWDAALATLDAAGLENGWVQEPFADTDHEEVSGWERARHGTTSQPASGNDPLVPLRFRRRVSG